MRYLFRLLLSLLGSLCPGKKYLVFGAWFGQRYSDNPKYLFEYLAGPPGAAGRESLVWITADAGIRDRLRSRGYRAHLSDTLASAFYISRARFVITCCGSGDVGQPLFTAAKFLELWHGIALKKIGFDAYDRNRNSFQGAKSIVGRYTSLYHPTFYSRNAYILSPSEYTDRLYLSAFDKGPRQILPLDQPRYHILKSGAPRKGGRLKIAYLPTHRSGAGMESIRTLIEELVALEGTLERLDLEVYVKLHFYNLRSVDDIAGRNAGGRIRFLRCDDRFFDLYRLLAVTDVLVTDYSSIYFDFMVTGRPVIALANDLEAYRSGERDLYVPYETFAFNGHFQSWGEVLRLIGSGNLSGFSAENPAYLELRRRMVGGERGGMPALQDLVRG